MEQTYPGPEDDRAHFASLLPAFRDSRYVAGGRPAGSSSTSPATCPIPPASSSRGRRWPPTPASADSTWWRASASPPTATRWPTASTPGCCSAYPFTRTTEVKVRDRLVARRPGPRARAATPTPTPWPTRRRSSPGRSCPPCTPTGTTPRGRDAWAWWPPGPPPSGSPPTCAAASSSPPGRPWDEQVLVVKSWNEWAEGNYLEPDREIGHGPARGAAATGPAGQLGRDRRGSGDPGADGAARRTTRRRHPGAGRSARGPRLVAWACWPPWCSASSSAATARLFVWPPDRRPGPSRRHPGPRGRPRPAAGQAGRGPGRGGLRPGGGWSRSAATRPRPCPTARPRHRGRLLPGRPARHPGRGRVRRPGGGPAPLDLAADGARARPGHPGPAALPPVQPTPPGGGARQRPRDDAALRRRLRVGVAGQGVRGPHGLLRPSPGGPAAPDPARPGGRPPACGDRRTGRPG